MAENRPGTYYTAERTNGAAGTGQRAPACSEHGVCRNGRKNPRIGNIENYWPPRTTETAVTPLVTEHPVLGTQLGGLRSFFHDTRAFDWLYKIDSSIIPHFTSYYLHAIIISTVTTLLEQKVYKNVSPQKKQNASMLVISKENAKKRIKQSWKCVNS